MVRFPPVAVAIVLAATTLAGCTLPFGDDGDGMGSFARAIRFHMDEDAMGQMAGLDSPEDLLRAFTSTSFTYTHSGPDVATDGLTVQYVDDDGRKREELVKELSGLMEMKRGDTFRLLGARMTSDVSIWDGATLLVARDGVRADWLEAAGYPLPVATTPGDAATWALDLDFGVDAEASRFAYDDEDAGSTQHVEVTDAALDMDLDASGTVEMATSGVGEDVRLDMDVELAGGMDMLGSAHVQATGGQDGGEDMDADFGADVDIDGTVDGTVSLFFDPTRGLERVGWKGSVFADGPIHVWDDEHPRSQQWEPDEVTHPLLDESRPYDEEVLDLPEEVLDTVAVFLDDLWNMDLAPGDSFTFENELDLFLAQVRMSYDVQVSAAGEKRVAAGTFDALRVHSVLDLGVTVDGEDLDLPTMESDLWVDRETYLPILAESGMRLDMDGQDLTDLLARMGEEAPQLSGASFHLEAASTMELQDRSGTPRFAAALFGAGNALMMPLMGPMLSASMLGAGFPEVYEESPPSMAFSRDDDADRLILVMVDAGMRWEDIRVMGTGPGAVAVNDDPRGRGDDPMFTSGTMPGFGAMEAGDELRFCGQDSETVTIIHAPTNTAVYEGTFTTLEAC